MSIHRNIKMSALKFIDDSSAVEEAARKIANDVDEFYFQALRPYGITKFNFKDYKERLRMDCVDASPTGTTQELEVYLDREHILTIEKRTSINEIKTDADTAKMCYKTELQVVWSKEG